MSTRSVPSTPAEPRFHQVPAIRSTRHHQIVVVGGGLAGATVSAWLCRTVNNPDVAVIEPSETHEYQPMWTLVGGGVVPKGEEPPVRARCAAAEGDMAAGRGDAVRSVGRPGCARGRFASRLRLPGRRCTVQALRYGLPLLYWHGMAKGRPV